MFSETMKDSRNLFFAYCLWHIGDGSARTFFFRKNFIWRHNDVIKNVYFLMKCSVKSVKHAFLTAILALLYEINMYFLNFYRLENEMKLMLKKKIFEIFWIFFSQHFHYLDKKPLTWGCLYTFWEVLIARIWKKNM